MIKYSTENGYTREDLEKLQNSNVCSVCKGTLDIYRKSISENEYFLACHDWHRTHHEEDVARLPSRYEKEGLASLNLEARRKLLTEEHRNTKAIGAVIDKYQGITSLTKPQAKEIIEAVYPTAPDKEIARAVLLCASYGLNPLMKHIYLICFGEGTAKEQWVTVMSIKSKRLLASRRGSYSYIDDTPRLMTDEEQVKRFGSADHTKLWAITKLKNAETGAVVPGYGWWPKAIQPYGIDKGNSQFNMATIRSESQALDRMFPGEMPVEIDVVPESYIEASAAGIKEEPIEAEVKEIDTSLGYCTLHEKALVPGKREGFKPYCPTKVEGTGRSKGKKVWCKGVFEGQGKPLTSDNLDAATDELLAESDEELEEALPSRLYDPDWLVDSLKQLHWADATVKSFITSTYKTDTTGTITEVVDKLDREQLAGFIKEIQERLDMR